MSNNIIDTPQTNKNSNPAISAKTHRSLKHKLKQSESSNYDSIFIIPCSGSQGWHELAEHSALIYYYEVCQHPKVQQKVNFHADDSSFYDQYEIGYIRTKNIDDIRTNLKKSGLYQSEQKSGASYTFQLTTKYTPHYIKELTNRENARRINNLTPGKTDNLDPVLHQSLAAIATRLHNLCNSHLNKLSGQVNGVRIINLADNMLISYHQITYFSKSQKNKIYHNLQQMRSDIYALIIEIQVISNTKLWSLEICISLATLMEKIRLQIESDIQRFVKNGTL